MFVLLCKVSYAYPRNITNITNNTNRDQDPEHEYTHRVHLPTLGLDGQVYVCMCMGRYSV